MSVLSEIPSFFKTTLLCIYAFLLHPFTSLARRAARHASSVTPYPLAPGLEGRVVDISHDSTGSVEKGTDLVQGVYTAASLHAGPTPLITPTTPEPSPACVLDTSQMPRSTVGVKNVKSKIPLSIVTNCLRTGPPHRRAASKTNRENNPQPPRKPTPLRRMPRYLNLTGSSPTKSAAPTNKSPCGSKSRRGSFTGTWLAKRTGPLKSVSFATPVSSPSITPLELESCVSGTSIDFAARVRSIFYKSRLDEDDDLEHESVRNLFNRDSVYSRKFNFESTDNTGAKDHDDDEEEDDYGKPLSLRSTCYSYSLSRASTIDMFFAPILQPSELPYLRDRAWSASSSSSGTSSSSSTVFNDLLASVERKYPASGWKEIVELPARGEDTAQPTGGSPYGGISADTESWSEVFCLEDYVR